MRTLDLRQQRVTVDELLRVARTESVRIVAEEGDAFILEVADAFEREVAELSQSEKFMAFWRSGPRNQASSHSTILSAS
jgi:hypothetical protein